MVRIDHSMRLLINCLATLAGCQVVDHRADSVVTVSLMVSDVVEHRPINNQRLYR